MRNLEQLSKLATSLPEAVQANAVALIEKMGETIEGIGDRPIVWRPSNLKLVQGTSNRSKLPKGAGIGSFVIGEDLAPPELEVYPIRSWTFRRYWNPDQENATILCNSPDAIVGYNYGTCRNCEYGKFNTETNKSLCNKGIAVLAIVADFSNIIIVEFTKSNYEGGTDWMGLMRRANCDAYKRRYSLSSVTSSKAKNIELIKVEPSKNYKTDAELFPFLKELFAISKVDREETLAKFYELVKVKTESRNSAVAIGHSDTSSSDSSSGDENMSPEEGVVLLAEPTTIVASEDKPASSSGKKRYSL